MQTSSDNTIVSSLESKLRDKRKTAEDESLYFAGLFWSAIGKPDKAKEYVDRVLRVTDSGVRKDALLCRGWIEIELCGQLSQDQANTLLTYFGDENRL